MSEKNEVDGGGGGEGRRGGWGMLRNKRIKNKSGG